MLCWIITAIRNCFATRLMCQLICNLPELSIRICDPKCILPRKISGLKIISVRYKSDKTLLL